MGAPWVCDELDVLPQGLAWPPPAPRGLENLQGAGSPFGDTGVCDAGLPEQPDTVLLRFWGVLIRSLGTPQLRL